MKNQYKYHSKICNETFNNVLNTFIKEKRKYTIEYHRNKRTLISGNQYCLVNSHAKMEKIKGHPRLNKTIKKLFTRVRIDVTDYIKKHNFQPPIIEKKFEAKAKKYDKYKELEVGEAFYMFDIDDCYWQIMKKIGIIPLTTYNKFIMDDELIKIQRNMSISMLGSNKLRMYYDENSKLINTIACDLSLYKQVYMNVRHTAYNIIGNIAHNILQGEFIKYNTDGITVRDSRQGDKVVAEFKRLGYYGKMTWCWKIDETTYKEDWHIKKF